MDKTTGTESTPETTTGRRRSGRRRGDSTTRAEILDAARNEFAEYGYDKATIRGIAQAAKVDPALVHHFFGTKQELFIAAVQVPIDPAAAIAKIAEGGAEGAGQRVVTFFLSIWDTPDRRSSMLTLIRSAVTHEQSADMLREALTRLLFGPLSKRLELDHPGTRISLVASQLVGLAMVRYVLRIEPVASASQEWLVSTLGGTIQRYLTEPLDLDEHPEINEPPHFPS